MEEAISFWLFCSVIWSITIMGQAALIDFWMIGVARMSAIAVLKFKINPIWLILLNIGLSVMQHVSVSLIESHPIL